MGFKWVHKFFCNFASLPLGKHYNAGSIGIDSRIYGIVSTSCDGIVTRKKPYQHLNGENNYALAA